MSKALGEFLARVGTYKPLYKSFISNAKNGNLECRDKNILYQVLKPQDTKEAFEAIAIEFTRSDTQEPMNKHLKSRIDHWKNLFTKYEPVFIKDKLSFVAKDIDKNQKIVGALLSCDLSAEPNTKFAPVTNDDIIFSLFDALIEVQDTIDSNKQIVPILKCYHQFLTTVNSGYKEQDILYNLVILSNLKAKNDGYNGVYAEPTGQFSQHLFEVLGYKKLGDILYHEYSNPITQEKTFYKLSEEFTKNSTRSTPTNNNDTDQLGCQICYKDLTSNEITELVGNVFESDNIN